MKNFSTYILVVFMVMFWIVRIIVTLEAQLGKNFMEMTPMDNTKEIIILFLTVLCLILVVRRKLTGALLYLTMHAVYYGEDITNKLKLMQEGQTLSLGDSTQFICSIIAIALALAVLVDMLLDKGRKVNPKDKKTDWFYKNKDFERKLDDRADKNNYRTM